MHRTMIHPSVTRKITFPSATIEAGKLLFKDENEYRAALKEGVFFVKIPNGLNVAAGIEFAENFYKERDGSINDSYRGFKNINYSESILGYSDRHDQVEQVQLELSLWEKNFPQELNSLLKDMNNIGLLIIEEIFRRYKIKEEFWDKITGGASQETALQYCIFNHYRQISRDSGITKHKDSGFVTVLYSPEPGLEAWINNCWVPINPPKGYFTINLGHSFEVLTQKMELPINAVDHQVKPIIKNLGEPDRYSFGTYIGPRFDMDLYQYTPLHELDFYKTFLSFQQEKAKEMGYEFHPKVKISKD